jgi:hypothetical protein
MVVRIYSNRAWEVARLYTNFLASETRDLAAHIDKAINDALEEAAGIADQHGQHGVGGEIRKLLGPKHES